MLPNTVDVFSRSSRLETLKFFFFLPGPEPALGSPIFVYEFVYDVSNDGWSPVLIAVLIKVYWSANKFQNFRYDAVLTELILSNRG